MYKAIVGLGNPGPQYTQTRHNIGFLIVDAFAKKIEALWSSNRDADITVIDFNNGSFILAKPQQFMNNSGIIIPLLKKRNIPPEEIIIVHDELDLPFGTIKIKKGGSARGHNGMRSIIAHGGEATTRVRVGIGRPQHASEVSDYVLSAFTEDSTEIKKIITDAINLLEQLVINNPPKNIPFNFKT